MAKPKATQADVDAFIRAVCPEAPELYAAAFTEKKCLNDATKIITRFRQALVDIATPIGDGCGCGGPMCHCFSPESIRVELDSRIDCATEALNAE